MGGKEALAVCSDKSLSIGITIEDIDSGAHLLHIPTSASPSHGLTCLASQCLVASQIHRQGSVAGGVIFIWPLNKPQAPVRSYPTEAIGPVACTRDGVFLVGGAPSGNAYVWEVWDLVTGRLLQTQVFLLPMTAIVLDPAEKMLFCGSADGRIFVNTLDIGLVEEASIVSEDEPMVLKGHNGSITALTFCGLGLISASEDCTACLWDVVNCPITNLVVIPQSSLLPSMNHHRAPNQFRVSILDKYPKPPDASNGVLTLLPSHSPSEDHCVASEYRSTNLLKQQFLDLEKEGTFASMQMKAETSIESQAWATRMTKHVMQMNKHLQSRLLDMMQRRLLQQPPNASSTTNNRKRKKTNGGSLPLQGKEQPQH
ncbi:hypothetical protein Acr_26g0006870 [Actinidia rufa]|uniref:Transducin/WD40 repeat-like superfamily protein n=1 Tax=Actinidia rufa TaxID=165716 RepID=A0A7J0H2U8_9ERIC|nr:hypothetical protein Acr_26g0006870 [Actinidia rufa]